MQPVVDEMPPSGLSLWQAVTAGRDSLPAKLRTIAAFVTDDPTEFIRMTSREICARLGTSEPTLIRFCRSLGFAGLADFRIELALAMAERGGAGQVQPQISDRRLINPVGKRRIADAALGIIAGDRALLMDNGTTLELLAERMGSDPTLAPATIMTSGLVVAQHLLGSGIHQVMLTGGILREATGALSGRLVETSLQGMNFDSFVVGADSIDTDGGVSTYSEEEAHANRAMIDAASRVIVLADHTKFGNARLHRICGLQRISILITDRAPPPDLASALAGAGAQVVVADQSPKDTP